MALNRSQLRFNFSTGGSSSGPRFAEFFAGIGLVRLGLEAAGWQLAYANDIDADKQEMYCAHFQDCNQHFDLEDIHCVRGADIPDVELATASFPCTDLSLAGGREGLTGQQSSTFWEFVRILKNMRSRRPAIVLLENVTGFITSRNGDDFEAAMLALNRLGYAVDVFMLDARWFVPQSRPRLFVIGTIKSGGASSVPPPTRLRPSLLTDYMARHQNIKWCIRDLPEPPKSSEESLKDILEDVTISSHRWWTKERSEYLYNQFSERHRSFADEMIGKRKWSYGTVFRRVRKQADGTKRSMAELRIDGIAGCLRTPKGGSGRQILFKAGYGRYAVRLITPRECARLMGANKYHIEAPDNQAYFGFGDAVCVPAITWIANNYLSQLLNSAGRVRSPEPIAAKA